MANQRVSFEALTGAFRWSLPSRFNIAVACCDRWAAADPNRIALIRSHIDGSTSTVNYGELRRDSDRFAFALTVRGINVGDRVAVLLPQSREAVVTHFAVYKLGGIAVPLAALFGTDALRYRLRTAGARAIVTDTFGAARIREIARDLPELETIISIDGPDGTIEGWHESLAGVGDRFQLADTVPNDPALMIFTSGTTGPPKGALHGHRVLWGHLPGCRFTHDFFPQPDDRVWTPSDWAWAGGLLNALLPSLYFGVPVVFGPFQRFDPEAAFALMARSGVRNVFLPPTAIRLLARVQRPRERFDLKLRTIGSAGEKLGREAYDWTREALGLTVNEFYGQTECNYVIGSSAALGVSKAGATGKALPGHRVAIIDDEGMPVAPGTPGQIAVAAPDPVMFLEYWNDPVSTNAKFVGEWLVTGDVATMDAEGFFQFVGRDDDIITSAGYRIGPSEIEECLATHPAVAAAAAVGKPDPVRTEIVKAFVELRPGIRPSTALASEIKRHVRVRLSAAEYPREIEFVEEVPMTTSGKIIRRGFRERVLREVSALSEE